MKLCRCPICHCDIHLDALMEDDAGREVLSILATKVTHGCAKPLVAYIGLFRTPKSNLSNSRTARLINEVLELYKPSRHLAHALSETVESIRAKRATGEYKPFKNHNYLKSVYESSKQLFAYTEQKEDLKPTRSTDDEYFEQMYKLGVDVTTLPVPGGKEWLSKKLASN